MGCSSGACSTMVMLPTMQSMQPTIPNTFRRSFRTICASTALRAHVLHEITQNTLFSLATSPQKSSCTALRFLDNSVDLRDAAS